MNYRFSSGLLVTAAPAAAACAAISVSATESSAQAAQKLSKTAWGEPDLQGIWIDEFDTPLQRPANTRTRSFHRGATHRVGQVRSGILDRRVRPRRQTAITAVSFTTKHEGRCLVDQPKPVKEQFNLAI
jgi:hypothetical protein